MRLTAEPPSRPEGCKSVCEVWDGSKWVSQQSVSVMTAKQRREEDRKFGAERKAQAVPVDIRGAYGPSASSINGIYEPTSEICGGWPVYRKQGDPDKWLEYIVATNEWYVKPTADRGRAEGWMCLASDPPTKPELCRGTCEVWDGDKWTIQTTVTVMTGKYYLHRHILKSLIIIFLIAQCGFDTMLDVQLFCAEELKGLQVRINKSLKSSIQILSATCPVDNVEEGNKQLDDILMIMGEKVKQLQSKKSEDAEKDKMQEENGVTNKEVDPTQRRVSLLVDSKIVENESS